MTTITQQQIDSYEAAVMSNPMPNASEFRKLNQMKAEFNSQIIPSHFEAEFDAASPSGITWSDMTAVERAEVLDPSYSAARSWID